MTDNSTGNIHTSLKNKIKDKNLQRIKTETNVKFNNNELSYILNNKKKKKKEKNDNGNKTTTSSLITSYEFNKINNI